MKEIKLTQNKIALIDDEDFNLISEFKWCAHKVSNTYYAATCLKDGRLFHMHSLLLLRESGYEIDHINKNGLDNRRSNIRLVTRSENNKNHNLRSDSTTGVTGVYYNKSNRNWYARISINKKWVYLGSFTTIEQASIARSLAEQNIYWKTGEELEINWRNV